MAIKQPFRRRAPSRARISDLERRMAEYYDAMTDSEIAEIRLWGELSEVEMGGSDHACRRTAASGRGAVEVALGYPRDS